MTEDEHKILNKITAVSDDFLAEIGRITAHFALLERDMIELVHNLLGLKPRLARAITSELSFRGLQQLAASLLREQQPEKVEQFEKILNRSSKAEEKRNSIQHSLWGSGQFRKDGTPLVIRTKFTAKQRKGLNFVREEMSVQDLRKIAHEISIAAYDVEMFNINLRSAA